jgi:uncharacterized protein with HEPN domain
MSNNERDIMILRKIVQYCKEIHGTCEQFNHSADLFASSYTFRNACSMCILQIGELAGKLSDATQSAIPSIPWKAIRGMRNLLAHNYGNIQMEATWATIVQDIPALQAACENYLKMKTL